ncbi:uncharacterized protein LOC110030282 isoform X2 [Phalaenopsis equestris]|uniref:uncharacterized protein LOC110030282 isoform X2 n=1 Tax=Phalaenopsis equestris TaxID=78828 RepID=UPI0009E1E236|nr:uncharacterized protein LOC110030282 isoform X2 [Phalaenopsis equestris]
MVEGKKRGYLSEDDCFFLFHRYNLTVIITLLKEIFEFADVKIDWKALVKSSSTGISNAQEYQMLWRHLAYCEPLCENLVGDEAREDDSDLEFELEAVPPVSAEALLQAIECFEVIMASGMTPKAHLSDVHISKASHSKEQALTPDYSETLRPRKRKRHPWTAEEENDLIAAVKKHGEGNWLNILKEDFKYDRNPSQLSQRWNIIKKRLASSNCASDDKMNSWVMQNKQLATRKAISMALNIPMIGSLSTPQAGVVSQHLNDSNEDHLEATIRILRRLKMTPGRGMIFN